jgi:asparagine synthase (glutamine-hydrolysing)
MTGIAGMIDLTGQGRADTELIRRMVGSLRHRGSGNVGFYESPHVSFGAAHLGIIDIHASQPLYNEDRTIALVFDGEIYNYRELREALKRRNHVLSAEGGGETILHLYEEYGLTLFSHLRGMFAFALWDSRSGKLILAVDHVGMKPLYLHERDGKLFFASEIRAIFADPTVPRQVNLKALDTYLSLGYMVGEDTLFEGVRRLAPGHVYVIEAGKSPVEQLFWELPKANPERLKRQETVIVNELRDLLADVTRIHLRSDVPLGILLDGSFESAALLALAAKESNGNLRTFSIGWGENSTSGRLASHFKTDHHEHTINPASWWRGLERSIAFNGEPVANADVPALYALSEFAAQQVKTMLTGLGAEAVFGGYAAHSAIPQLLASRRSGYKDSAPIQNMLELKSTASNSSRVRADSVSKYEVTTRLKPLLDAVFDGEVRKKLYRPHLSETALYTVETFTAQVENSWRDDPYDTAQALVLNTWVATNGCLALDRATMAASLEGRTPFFDPILLKFATDIPTPLRLGVLHEAVPPYLPDFALEPSQQVNRSRLMEWFEGELSESIREVLLNPNAFINDFFNRDALENLLKDHFWGRAKRYEIIFRLLILELWGQAYIKPPVFNPEA